MHFGNTELANYKELNGVPFSGDVSNLRFNLLEEFYEDLRLLASSKCSSTLLSREGRRGSFVG